MEQRWRKTATEVGRSKEEVCVLIMAKKVVLKKMETLIVQKVSERSSR